MELYVKQNTYVDKSTGETKVADNYYTKIVLNGIDYEIPLKPARSSDWNLLKNFGTCKREK